MARRMEENRYDDLTQSRLHAPMTKVVVWDGEVYVFDLGEESNTKLNEHMSDMLQLATKVEGDDLNTLVSEGIGGERWTPENSKAVDDLITETLGPDPDEQPKSSNGRTSTFSDDDVRTIRKQKGKTPVQQLADEYGVSTASIYSIQNKRTYAHVK